MASTSSPPTASAAISKLTAAADLTSWLPRARQLSFSTRSSKLPLLSSSKVLSPRRRRSSIVKAHVNKVTMPLTERLRIALHSIFITLAVGPILFMLSKNVAGPSNDVPAAQPNPEEPATEDKGTMQEEKSPESPPLSVEALSQFMNQVASLVELVDSQDIVELQLKQQDCELIIRKKEALPQPSPPAHVVMMQQPVMPTAIPSPVAMPPVAAPASSPASAPPALQASAATAPKASKSSHPRFKSPMAGTFYRCPGPGQPPFVKVGDKVNKGQILCIIEAMKLMNEIQADQAGTVVEILVDDAKPVSIGQPLFVIAP